jgi:hypothetical protein
MTALKWYHFDQNNSGGYFVNNDDVGEDVFIQALSSAQASTAFYELDTESDNWCECCGERWGAPDEQDQPNVYGKMLADSYSPYSSQSHAVLYFSDGRKAIVKPF